VFRRYSAALLAALVFLLVLPRAVVAQQLDVIRGQVVNPEAQPIENATVTATLAARASTQVRNDSS